MNKPLDWLEDGGIEPSLQEQPSAVSQLVHRVANLHAEQAREAIGDDCDAAGLAIMAE